MSRNWTGNKTRRDKTSWLKRLLQIVAVIVVAALILVVIAKYWLIPAVIQQQLVHAVSEFLGAKAELKEVEVNYFGPIYLRDIRLFDKAQCEWLHLPVIKVSLSDWPSTHPVLTEIDIEGLDLRLSADRGKYLMSLVSSSGQVSNSQDSFLDLHTISIRNSTVTIVGKNGATPVYDNLTLLVSKKNEFYNILFHRVIPKASERFSVQGTINSTNFNTNLLLKMTHTFKQQHIKAILALFDICLPLGAEGELFADMVFRGCLKEPSSLYPKGIVTLNNWVLTSEEHQIVSELCGVINLNSRRISCDKLTAVTCNGWVEGTLFADIKQEQPTEFCGQISANKIDLAQLTAALNWQKKTANGVITIRYNFTGKGNELTNLRGDGDVLLDDTDVRFFPVLPYVFGVLGLGDYNPLKMSDAECTFSTEGPTVTFKTAHIANGFGAVEVEPGGTVNLQTGYINMYVVGIPLRQIDVILKHVPVVGLFASLKDKLTRLHIKGHVSDPSQKLVTKEPLHDLKEGTVGFLTDVVKTGGQFSQEVLKKFGILQQNDKSKNK